jgi:CRISPR-associated protein Cas1
MQPDVRVGVDGEFLEIRSGENVIDRFRLEGLDELLVFGPAELTPAAMARLLARGVDVVFLTSSGRYRGRLVGPASRQGAVRLAQYRAASDPAVARATAAAIVSGKIRAQRELLLRHQRRLKDEVLSEILPRLRHAAEQVAAAADLDEVRGCEGAAAAAYWQGFARAVRHPSLKFQKRTKRPPEDEINAMLSFGYAVLLSVVESAALRAGLDPAIGTLHEVRAGRPSMALDLMEEFRPQVVDAVVLRLVNRGQVGPGDFERPARLEEARRVWEQDEQAAGAGEEERPGTAAQAVYLGPVGRRVFLTALFARLRERVEYPPAGSSLEWGEIITRQAYAMARALETGGRYEPFVAG